MNRHLSLLCTALMLSSGASLAHASFTMTLSDPAGDGTTSGAVGYGTANHYIHVLDAGFQSAPASLGSTLDGLYRYTSTTSADTEAGDPFYSHGYHHSQWSFAFTISAPVGYTYDVVIETQLKGAHALLFDGQSGYSYTTLTDVVGELDFVPEPGLSLSTAGSQAVNNTNQYAEVDGSNVFSLTGLTGTNTHHVEFSWTNEAVAFAGGSPEAAFLLGHGDTSGVATADDYSTWSRDMNLDGHWAKITATITAVPETSSLLMTGIAGASVCLPLIRRRLGIAR